MGLRQVVAVVTTVAFLQGCGASATWPGSVTTLSTQRAHPVRSIDVLPLDLQLWGDPQIDGDVARITAETSIMSTALSELENASIGTTVIDWNGDAKAGNVMAKDDLVATIDSLATYGEHASESPHQLPVPYLPARLGNATGSDATLYVGGWAYVAYHEPSHVGEDIAKGVLIAVAVIAVIGLIALATKSSKGGSHGGGHGGAGGGGSHINVSAGRAITAVPVTHVVHHVHGAQSSGAIDPTNIALDTLDAFGHVIAETPVSRPDWTVNAPHDGDSQMYLEMTLVDNSTGLVLWHARQQFPAGANQPDQVAHVTRQMLAAMPR